MEHEDPNTTYRLSAGQFLAAVAHKGIASVRLAEWPLDEDPDELELRRQIWFRYCAAVDITLGGDGNCWRFTGHESEGTLQPWHAPPAANWKDAETIDDYLDLPVESASFGSLEKGLVVSLEVRFTSAESLYLFACEFDDGDPDKLMAGEEVVALFTSREQAERAGLIHRPIELDAARFE